MPARKPEIAFTTGFTRSMKFSFDAAEDSIEVFCPCGCHWMVFSVTDRVDGDSRVGVDRRAQGDTCPT
jgi:hypothetical protein